MSVSDSTTFSGPVARRTAWTLNLRLLVISLAALTFIAPCAVFWHGYQVRKHSDAYVRRAEELEKNADWLAATGYWHRALVARPADSEIPVRLAQSFDHVANSPGAKSRLRDMYTRAIGVAADRGDLRRRLAELLVEAGQYRTAEQQIDAVLAEEPNEPVALKLKALVLDERLHNGEPIAQKVAAAYRVAHQQSPADCQLAGKYARLVRLELTEPGTTDRESLADTIISAPLRADPTSPAAWLLRYAYRLEFRLPDADSDLAEALKLAPDDPAVLTCAAARAASLGKNETAQAHYRRLLAVSPADRKAYSNLSELLAHCHRFDEAKQVASDGLQMLGNDDLLLNVQLAKALIGAREFDSAQQRVTHAVKLAAAFTGKLPAADRARLNASLDCLQATLLMGSSQFREAADLLKRAVVHAPIGGADDPMVRQHASAWCQLGVCHRALGEPDLALAAFEKGVGFQPHNAQYILSAAESLEALGQVPRAIELYRSAADLDPTGPAARALAGKYAVLTNWLVEQRRIGEAIDVYLSRLESQASQEESIQLCALLSLEPVAGARAIAAQRILDRSLEENPAAGQLLNAVATVHYLRGETADAQELYQRILELQPDNWKAMNNLANLLSDSGEQSAEAIRLARKAIDIRGENPELLDTLGVALLHNGSTNEAIAALEKAVEAPDADSRFLLHLAAARLQKGDQQAAANALDEARRLKIDKTTLTSAEQKMLAQLTREISGR